MGSIPIVAIVGRQNVGKSSLLNAMARQRISIVDPKPGVTRDRVAAAVRHRGKTFEAIDTGGLGMDEGDAFRQAVTSQALSAIASADLVVFLVDVVDGCAPMDGEIAAMLRREGKRVIVAANKADNARAAEGISEFYRLGFGDVTPISALHRRGIADLLDRIAASFQDAPASEEAAPRLKIAIVGKRNVGKSSLVNRLAQAERVIVSEIPGTTRDSVDVVFERDGFRYVVIDTAGVRKKAKVEDSVELFSRFRTERSIHRADVVLFVMDVEMKVTQIDKALAAAIEESRKPCVVLLNKWDKTGGKHGTGEFIEYLNEALPVMAYAPVVFASAKTGFNVGQILDAARDLASQAETRIPTPQLNRVVRKVQGMGTGSAKRSGMPKVYYATQVGVKPQCFLLFVNDAALFTPQHVRTIENRFREILPIHEVPVTVILRNRTRRDLSAGRHILEGGD